MTTPLVSPPYGRDTSCTDRLYPGRVVSGGVLLGEALYRRFRSEREQLQDDADYGLSMDTWLGAAAQPDLIASIPGQLQAEAAKDKRIDEITVTMIKERIGDSPGIGLTIVIEGTGVEGETFEFAVHINDVTVELLRLEGSGG